MIGFVGNTGNARTTHPHLHFGVYRRGEGAVDPAPFLRTPRGSLAELTADVSLLGRWMRTGNGEIHLRAAPGARAEVVRELGRYTPVRILAGSGDWYRVRLPDGVSGYVAARLTESLDRPIETRTAFERRPLLSEPGAGAAVVSELDAGQELPVLGHYGSYLYVRAPTGSAGWIDAGRILTAPSTISHKLSQGGSELSLVRALSRGTARGNGACNPSSLSG